MVLTMLAEVVGPAHYAALPPDGRKVSDLPAMFLFYGACPSWGRSPDITENADRWGIATTAHQTAQPQSFQNS